MISDDDEIVISGFSGRFPKCNTVEEFKEALFKGENLTTYSEKRYPIGYKGLPLKMGTIPDIETFDASFFGINPKQANSMDPRHRILLETTFESIYDAGYNPDELRGTKTGVYVGMQMSQHLAMEKEDNMESFGYAYLGKNAFHASNIISYTFDFKGPSCTMDTACSSSMYAMNNAYEQLKYGDVDYAIVSGSTLITNLAEAEAFLKLDLLNKEGACKVFNYDRKGFAMSEAIVSYFLQRKKNCRRQYATVLNSKTNVDGFKKEGLLCPSSQSQSTLLKEAYAEAKISVDDLSYIEIHGTGTQIGDRVECESLSNVFRCRKKPLLIGSVKSSIGHCLQSSGLVGITKVILAMETGMIPRNLYVDNIDNTLPGIKEETLQIVKTNTPFTEGLVSVCSFGIGGANAHVLLEPNKKPKCISKRVQKYRLVQVSGRTKEAVEHVLDEIEENKDDEEFLSLIDEIHKRNVEGHYYRGYTVLGETPKREIAQYKSGKRPIWFIYSGMGSQWAGMARDLMHMDVFRNTFNKCAKALINYGIDLENIIMNGSEDDLEDIENCFGSIIAVSVSVTDLLTSLGIVPDFVAGHSLGEIGCAYVNGDITPEQAVLIAYSRGYACKKTTLPIGQMAAIGMTKENLNKLLPKDICIACQNSKDNFTISGPKDSVIKFTEELTKQGVFNKLVKTANIAFHCKYLMDADQHMAKFLQGVLTDPKPRLKKWISTSVPTEKRMEKWANYNCLEYHVNNFKNTVFFDEIYQHLQDNAIVIEIAPHGILNSILKREMNPDNTLIRLLNKTVDEQDQYFLSSIGQIYLAGAQPNLRNLYKDVSFPVGRSTKMMSSLIQWDHSTSYYVPKTNPDNFGKIVTVNISNKKHEFLKGHNLDGRVIMPGALYLEMVWAILAEKSMKDIEDLPVIFENVKFTNIVILRENENVEFLANIFKESGSFEVLQGSTTVCVGKITAPNDVSTKFIAKEVPKRNKKIPILNRDDFYKECHLRQLMYKDQFQSISQMDIEAHETKIEWYDNFTTFIDGMFQISIVAEKSRDFIMANTLKKLTIDPRKHLEEAEQAYITVMYDSNLRLMKSKGIELLDFKITPVPKHNKNQLPLLETYEFINYNCLDENYNLNKSMEIAVQIIIQNMKSLVKLIKVMDLDEMGLKKGLFVRHMLTEIQYSTGYIPGTYDTIIIPETHHLCNYIKCLNKDGFIIYCGKFNSKLNELDIIFQTCSMTLFRLKNTCPLYEIIKIENTDFKWLEKLQKSSKEKTILLLSQSEKNSGLLGLAKCLMAEDSRAHFKAVLSDQSNFSIDKEFYKNQLAKNLSFNVLKNNKWGTYIHMPLGNIREKSVKNARVSLKTLGDLSTLCWVQMPGFLPKDPNKASEIIDVKYMSLNFRDTLVATGNLRAEIPEPTDDDTNMIFEFSGVAKSGRRVMGTRFYSLFNTQLQNETGLTWDVPDDWTLEEAATVPVVYITCYYGLILRGQMDEGNSILIHAGAGGVGMAAIRIALSLKATIFTTVNTQEKKEFLLKTYPQIEEANIGNSRDSSFYNLIKTKTEGRGVDIILNSLSGELFQTSLRCLAVEGRFIEIGKMDLISGSPIDSSIFLNNCSVHGIMIDKLLKANSKMKERIFDIVKEGIVSGVVKPLPRTVFEKTQLGEAWKYLSSGKNKGKVIIKLLDEKTPGPANILAIPKIKFDPEKVFIIIGGLGGMGLELTYWLLEKGARKIIINSRRDIWNGYQALSMNKWLKYKNAIVNIDLSDTSNYESAKKMVLEAQQLGNIAGIFNTALVLRDKTLPNLTQIDFEDVFRPKVYSSENMDTITRKCCPHLNYFVLFSSIVAGRGNISQSNYGMANAVLENLCENRRKDNLPGLAIQWGPVGDVGALINENTTREIFNCFENQSISSCLDALEKFMIQDVVVGSSVVLNSSKTSIDKVVEKTPASIVSRILGIDNTDSIDKSKRLYEFGLDSLMVLEMTQALYRNFQLEFSAEKIRDLNFDYLDSLHEDSIKKT